MQKKEVRTLEAIATITGTIIGAGVLGIPYVVAKAGFLTGALDILVLGAAVMLIFLYFGEVVLRTKETHQMTGYAEKYLGKWGKRIMAFAMVFGIYGALIAYILGEGEALAALVGGPPMLYSLLFFIVAAALVYFGLKAIARSELLLGMIMLVVIIIIIALTAPYVKLQNLAQFNIANFFIPYGVILFAFMGAVSVVEAKEELTNRKKLKKCIIWGCLIPIIAYFIFTLVVVGSTGSALWETLRANERVATVALVKVVGYKIAAFGNLFAIFAMGTSFLALGLALKEMYIYDYHLNRNLAWSLTVFIPLAIALLNLTNFIQAINISGVIAGGAESILVVLMFLKAKKMGEREPEYKLPANKFLAWLLIALFVVGVLALLY